MDFSLSEEQELLQDTVRSYTANECPPPRVREVFDGESGHDADLWKGLVEMGLAGLAVPEAHGGAGLGLLDSALVCEVLGAGAVPAPFLGHTLAVLALRLGGSAPQQERWLPALASGDRLGTVALGEAGGAWAPEEWTLSLQGERADGAKTRVPAGPEAGLVVVGGAGGALGLVDASAGGLRWSAEDSLDRGRRLYALELEEVPIETLAPGTGARVRDAALVLLAADAFGAGTRLVRMAVDYAQARQQFGQPIAAFQAVKHQLANMALDIDPTRGLFWYAAHAFDHLPEESARAAALAKAHITDRAMQVARDAIEIHGGIGMTWECDAQIWFKRALFDRQWAGTPDTHRARLADLGGW
ncbi:MAG: acyl-CoA dehydrogenase family protein [Planctomycetota bacterium]|jgi:alkylation response protein AidB-like acyl-CoA dehydrogenase|nr:acyl-CoA dehydrogenase [Deltaproteobacteria bacterium]MDP6540712.1 acyl-CoA dehydrogenase family protein [Planctomycetota bacterium]